MFFINVVLVTALAALPGVLAAQAAPPVTVSLETSLGVIVLELDVQRAPKTVENFLEYANSGFYDGTVFHRVIEGFMIQGGGFSPSLTQKVTRPPIANESGNGLSNGRGTIAMARTNDPNSATAQFFINTVDNTQLDSMGGGYAVFGRVVKGLEVVDAVAKVPTGVRKGMRDVPVEDVVILKVKAGGN